MNQIGPCCILWLFYVLITHVYGRFTYYVDDTVGFGRRFDGVGGLSGGGATSKLLVNYPQAQRDAILDYLFKPNFGASLQILKVEIGGDAQSTDGTEASHMHYSWDLNFQRGYEWWLMTEAKKRNPEIKLYGLPWGFPGWVGGGTQSPYSFPKVTSIYICKWIIGAKNVYNLTIDYIGIWNERPYDITYILTLRKTLDLYGLRHVQIVAADESSANLAIVKDILRRPNFANAVSIIGTHQPHTESNLLALETGKPLWASEDFSQKPDNYGGACWARSINQDYTNGFITAQISWCVINSMYDGLPYSGNGLMRAVEPWSGYYYVAPPIWASAHTTQFTKPGWLYLKHGSGVGNFSAGGSYVTLMSPDKKDFSIIIETGTFNHSHCRRQIKYFDVKPQNVTLQLKGTLGTIDMLYVWYTKLTFDSTESTIFKQLVPIKVINGQINLSLGIDEIWTLSTISNGHKGQHSAPPPSQPFTLPYRDDFDTYPVYSEAYNLVQQSGIYEVIKYNGTNKVIRQMTLDKPVAWEKSDLLGPTINLIGQYTWKNIKVSVSARIAPINGTSGLFVATRLVNRGLNTGPNSGLFFFIFPASKTYVVSGDAVRKYIHIRGSNIHINSNGWNNLTIVSMGSWAYGMVNNHLTFNTTIPSGTKSGFVGFGTTTHRLADFDNLHIDNA